MIKSKENYISAVAFLMGVVLAIVIGVGTSSFFSVSKIVTYSSHIYATLVVLGLIIGFSINVSRKDSQTFLITSAILVLVSWIGMQNATESLIGIGIGDIVSTTFGALIILFVPTTIIVALKTVFGMVRV